MYSQSNQDLYSLADMGAAALRHSYWALGSISGSRLLLQLSNSILLSRIHPYPLRKIDGPAVVSAVPHCLQGICKILKCKRYADRVSGEGEASLVLPCHDISCDAIACATLDLTSTR